MRALVAETPDQTITELWQKITTLGIRVGRSAVARFLLHLQLTFKKNPACRRAGTPGRQALRRAQHHLYGNVFLDLDCGRIVMTLDVDRIRADFIVSADNVEDPMDLGRGSGTIGARWHNWQCEESEGKGNCSHNGHRFFSDCLRRYTRKVPVMRQNARVGWAHEGPRWRGLYRPPRDNVARS